MLELATEESSTYFRNRSSKNAKLVQIVQPSLKVNKQNVRSIDLKIASSIHVYGLSHFQMIEIMCEKFHTNKLISNM